MMVGPMIKNPSTRNASQLTHTKNNSSARKISIILSHYPNFFVKVSSNSRLELYYISTWVFECPKGHIWHLQHYNTVFVYKPPKTSVFSL